jgi:glucokinase
LKAVLSLDIGATWTRVGLFSVDGRLLAIEKWPTPRSTDGYRVAEEIAEHALHVAKENPRSVGIAVFGPIDFRDGRVYNPPNHPAREIPLREAFEERVNSPVILVNDAVAGVWSEYILGLRRSVEDLVHVAIGTGIGVGVIIGGRLILGRRGDSHEAGHIVIDYSSNALCGCGGRGHWEALASGRVARDVPVEILEQRIAAGIATLVACYDPEIIVLSGGVVSAGIISLDRIRKLVKEYSFQNRSPPLRLHSLGSHANLYGAYLLAARPPEEILRLNGF